MQRSTQNTITARIFGYGHDRSGAAVCGGTLRGLLEPCLWLGSARKLCWQLSKPAMASRAGLGALSVILPAPGMRSCGPRWIQTGTCQGKFRG
jgi:hypothetical protein